jgi:hypothetical protein
MHTPIRHVGVPIAISPPPEAQYQDEFYRFVFSTTGTARRAHVVGHIYFFVPAMKWII